MNSGNLFKKMVGRICLPIPQARLHGRQSTVTSVAHLACQLLRTARQIENQGLRARVQTMLTVAFQSSLKCSVKTTRDKPQSRGCMSIFPHLYIYIYIYTYRQTSRSC